MNPPETTPSLQPELGRRLAVVRERLGLTQHDLSERLGFKDRQTLQTIEAGKRTVSADELVAILEATGCDLDFFTDPFRLVEDGKFSFRARGAGEDGLIEFEDRAGRWVAFWRHQGRKQGIKVGPLRQGLQINAKSSYAEAAAVGEALWQEWQLGDVPAERLAECAETRLGLLVLQVEMPAGISGAACQTAGADTVLVNRNEPEGRRNFDLAHELFHVLTWDALPPRRVDRENPSGYKDKHVERLADNFAGALLMPLALLQPRWEARPEAMSLDDWISATATKLKVSGVAVKWRLVNAGLLDRADLFEVHDEALAMPSGSPPSLFSRAFMERAGGAIERGDVSAMRLVKLLAVAGRGELKDCFQSHGLPVPEGI